MKNKKEEKHGTTGKTKRLFFRIGPGFIVATTTIGAGSIVSFTNAGAAGIAITKLLLSFGFKDILLCDSRGIVARDDQGLNSVKQEIAEVTNTDCRHGTLADALEGADIFVGVRHRISSRRRW